jgi:hypothetical protein
MSMREKVGHKIETKKVKNWVLAPTNPFELIRIKDTESQYPYWDKRGRIQKNTSFLDWNIQYLIGIYTSVF